MKIGLNGQKLLQNELAGPEIYTLNVFRSLAKIDHDNQYIVYFEETPKPELWNEISQNNKNFSYKVLTKILSWTQISLAVELLKSNVDAFFTAVHTIPAIHNPKLKIISVIHGLEFKINKQYYKNIFAGLIHPLIIYWVLVFSKTIIAPSTATKNAILKLGFIKKNKWLNISQKVRVITEGVSENFTKVDDSKIEQVREKYKLSDSEFLFFLSTIQPRKNIPNMVEAFSLALKDKKIKENTLLVISGKKGWLFEESLNAAKKFGVEENVLYIGRAPDDDLPALFSASSAFISCSLEEGFGLPLLEAMACETPAVVSNIPAFKELGGDYQIYVDPKDVNSIKEGIIKVLNERNENNIKAAKELSKNYTWENVAKDILNEIKCI